MASDLSNELRQYLKRCGLSERKISRCSGNTRMYHDLGLYGDIAEAFMQELVDHYHVDLSGFEFDKFFPPEFAGKNAFIGALLSVVPFASYVVRQRGKYLPLTLRMMEDVLRTKQWRAVERL
ncbi:DUF1493 family protein [Massilia soli]|uniref:DUF1493 family protein n=1 Tax=Massilia soli TaxID=2792854 RepID=A0ABS7SKQ6_9BURK|nr:DUF1493 family protein [Massilia soli]MBZ2206371.1 DUF1493 family protein [Massilia soli]